MNHQNPVKRLLSPLVNPAVYDFWASHLNRTWSWERALARVVGREPASTDSVTLTLRPNRNFAGFQPGQHVHVTVEIGGVRHTRSYSPSDRVREDGLLQITVKQIPGGRVSGYLCRDIQVGDVLELSPAFGEMLLPGPARPLLLLAGGSGITPLISQLRQLTRRPLQTDVTLIYWARSREELCFREELRALAASEPRLSVLFGLTRNQAGADDERGGRPAPAWFDGLPLQDMQVHACGPAGFVATLESLLKGKADVFHGEAFTPPAQVTEEGAPVKITLRRSGRVVSVPSGKALLPALEAQGIQLAHGCRMGICNTCVCDKVSGIARNVHDGHSDPEPGTQLKICINAAQSDLVLDV